MDRPFGALQRPREHVVGRQGHHHTKVGDLTQLLQGLRDRDRLAFRFLPAVSRLQHANELESAVDIAVEILRVPELSLQARRHLGELAKRRQRPVAVQVVIGEQSSSDSQRQRGLLQRLPAAVDRSRAPPCPPSSVPAGGANLCPSCVCPSAPTGPPCGGPGCEKARAGERDSRHLAADYS